MCISVYRQEAGEIFILESFPLMETDDFFKRQDLVTTGHAFLLK